MRSLVWFSCFLLSVLLVTVAEAQIVQVSTGCSGVAVRQDIVVTAKHCIDGSKDYCYFTDPVTGKNSAGVLISKCSGNDGPCFYRTAPVWDKTIKISEEIKVREKVRLKWVNQSRESFGTINGSGDYRVSDPSVGVRNIFANSTDAWCVPGASGGAALNDNGELVGVILFGDVVTRKETGLSTLKDISAGYRLCTSMIESYPVCTAYLSTHCRPCQQFMKDYQSGRYSRVPVEMKIVFIDKEQYATGIETTPTFEIGSERMVVSMYDGDMLSKWMTATAKKQMASQETQAQMPVPDPISQSPAPTQPQYSDPLVDIDWSGVRIIALASKDCPVSARLLAGPMNRLIEAISGGRCSLEIVAASDRPLRYTAVHKALGTYEADPPLYIVVLVDEIAHVGFMKGMILKQIEKSVDEAVQSEDGKVPIDAVFARTSKTEFRSITRAMEVSDPEADKAEEEGSGKSLKTEEENEEKEDEEASKGKKLIVFLTGIFGWFTGSRAWKYLMSWIKAHHKEQQHATEASLAPPAPVPQSATQAPGSSATV